jgi:hypothetical protein
MNMIKLTKKLTPRRRGLIITSSEAGRLRIPEVTRKQLAEEADRQATTGDKAATKSATSSG